MSFEKRFPASKRKLEQSRKEGDIGKSSILSAACSLGMVGLLTWVFIQPFQMVTAIFDKTLAVTTDFHSNHMLLSFSITISAFMPHVIALLLVVGLTGVLVEVCQVGLYVLPGHVLRFSRLNLIHGFRRMIGLRETSSGSLAPVGIPEELAKYIVQLLLMVMICGLLLLGFAELLLYLEFRTAMEALSYVEILVRRQLLILGVVWIVLGVAELALLRHRRRQKLRMTRTEVMRELRESEGDPQVAELRRQTHQEISMHQVIEHVRRAKAVVVN